MERYEDERPMRKSACRVGDIRVLQREIIMYRRSCAGFHPVMAFAKCRDRHGELIDVDIRLVAPWAGAWLLTFGGAARRGNAF